MEFNKTRQNFQKPSYTFLEKINEEKATGETSTPTTTKKIVRRVVKKKKTLSDELKKADVDQAAAYAEQMRAQKTATGSGESVDKTRKEDEPDRLDKQPSDKQQKEPFGLLFFLCSKIIHHHFIISNDDE